MKKRSQDEIKEIAEYAFDLDTSIKCLLYTKEEIDVVTERIKSLMYLVDVSKRKDYIYTVSKHKNYIAREDKKLSDAYDLLHSYLSKLGDKISLEHLENSRQAHNYSLYSDKSNISFYEDQVRWKLKNIIDDDNRIKKIISSMVNFYLKK